jgi:hypothetical protein
MRLPLCIRSRIDKTSSPFGCWLWIGGTHIYGQVWYGGKMWMAHRLIWALLKGPIPKHKKVLHDCPGGDNTRCCNPDHLWLGTQKQNVADMVAKGRQARGTRHGSKTHPERMNQPKGDQHWTRLHPEWLARGDQNGSRTHPERLVQGVDVSLAKLTEADVRVIRKRYSTKVTTHAIIAADYSVSAGAIRSIVTGKTWRHI